MTHYSVEEPHGLISDPTTNITGTPRRSDR
jgi:hypothetical protein